MQESEIAWIVREFVGGRPQVGIAREIGASPSVVCSGIKEFCNNWSGHDVEALMAYNEARRKYAHVALRRYLASPRRVVVKPDPAPFVRRLFQPRPPAAHDREPGAYNLMVSEARHEHAWLLRAEQCSLREIGNRLGLSRERSRQMIYKFGKRMARAMRRARFSAKVRDHADGQSRQRP